MSVPHGSAAPRVSIVVPAYNAESFLARTVASAQEQTVSGWEMVIVDDGSTDATVEIADALAESDPRIRVLHQKNGGLSNARNNGAAATSPAIPHLIFLDADDLWLPDVLESLLDALEAHPEWGGVYVLGEYIDENDRSIRPGELEAWCTNRLRVSEDRSRRVAAVSGEPTTFEMIAMRNYIPSSGAVLLRRGDFERSGGFLERLCSLEDWHQWVRMSLHKPFGVIDRVLYRYRRHGGNMSANVGRMNRETYRAARHIAETCRMPLKKAAHFQRSQTVLTHLYWAREDFFRVRLSGALYHLTLAVRNAFDYTARPALARLLHLRGRAV